MSVSGSALHGGGRAACAAGRCCLVLLVALALLYRFGPSPHGAKWRWISSAPSWRRDVADGLRIVVGYLSKFAHYDATYGSLGAAIGLMMWMWLTFIAVLLERRSMPRSSTGPRAPAATQAAGTRAPS